ncbi:hypothetical protein I8254_15400 [Providencia rettgeri]|uniref:hypothetical protein n=1 Tax=Providencia rettgeri TaxID=587 RepID=UPI001903E227|nr:hypothetical protein [Providencia rettgeri]MBJ9972383.1 hypothetical protein [Providencia rettgeri]
MTDWVIAAFVTRYWLSSSLTGRITAPSSMLSSVRIDNRAARLMYRRSCVSSHRSSTGMPVARRLIRGNRRIRKKSYAKLTVFS